MKVILYELFNYVPKFFGPIYRNVGRKMYELGNKIEGPQVSQDRLVPSLRRLAHEGVQPDLEDADFVAPNATVLGNVRLGDRSSIWYGATLIGTNSIKIGSNSVIQDRVHISRNVNIGSNVFIGPNSIIQGSTINDRAFIAMGATIRHATVEKGGFVAAGAVVFDNAIVKQGQIWAGNPAKFLRKITPLQRQVLREHLDEMQDLACMHNQQTEKTFKEIINQGITSETGGDFDQFLQNVMENTFGFTEYDMEYAQRRVLMRQKLTYPQIGQDYEPYRFEQKDMPEKFRLGIHQEEFAKVAIKMKEKTEFSDNKGPWASKY